jgi:hypothetical protein
MTASPVNDTHNDNKVDIPFRQLDPNVLRSLI